MPWARSTASSANELFLDPPVGFAAASGMRERPRAGGEHRASPLSSSALPLPHLDTTANIEKANIVRRELGLPGAHVRASDPRVWFGG